MVVQLLGDFGSQKRIAYLTNMQPGATAFNVTTVGRPIRKLIWECLKIQKRQLTRNELVALNFIILGISLYSMLQYSMFE